MTRSATGPRTARDLTRRAFVQGALAGGGLVAVGGAGLWSLRRAATSPPEIEEPAPARLMGSQEISSAFDEGLPTTDFDTVLQDLVADMRLSSGIGEAFLRSPVGLATRDLSSLFESLRIRLGLPRQGVRRDPDALADLLRQAVRRDFVEGRLCYVNGWYLSLTECRLAALKHLLERSGPAAASAGAPPASS